MVDYLTRNWWMLLVRGGCAIVFGVLAFANPGATLGALVFVFGAYALVDGLVALAAALLDRQQGRPRWLVALAGLASLGAGLIAFAWPGATALTALYVIAVWAIAIGVLQ